MHSFRHSMRDRLRAVNCPSEMIDQIGGWLKRSVGEGYGEGFSAASIMNFTQKIALNTNGTGMFDALVVMRQRNQHKDKGEKDVQDCVY